MASVTDILCLACNLLLTPPTDEAHTIMESTVKELQEPPLHPCRFCSIIRETFPFFGPVCAALDPATRVSIVTFWEDMHSLLRAVSTKETSAEVYDDRDVKYIKIKLWDGEHPDIPKNLQLTAINLERCAHGANYWNEKRSSLMKAKRDSSELLSCARLWLEECCAGSTSEGMQRVVPARLLDLGHPDDSAPHQVRLNCNPSISDRYATLSYCWGGDQAMKLTVDRLPLYNSAIPTELLPGAIRDAVKVTRALGLHYLWVDAYCIIQDSREDKNIEISKMAEIFENAAICIAASCAKTVDNSFLQLSTLPATHSLQIRGKYGPKELLLKQETPQPFSTEPLEYDSSLEPINARAWTLEERLLSPRVLSFPSSDYEVIFRCDHGLDTTLGRKNLHFYRFRDGDTQQYDYRSLDSLLEAKKQSSTTDLLTSFGQLWDKMIKDYCSRAMTRRSDKLRAIAGLAARFQQRTGILGEYYAGLWSADLRRGLLWIAGNHSKRCEAYNFAPSWSWASMEGPVNNFNLDPRAMAASRFDLENISYVQVPRDHRIPHGPVERAVLTVTGYLIPVSEELQKARAIKTERRKICHDSELELTVTFDDDQEYGRGVNKIFALPVRHVTHSDEFNGKVEGLVLRRNNATSPRTEYCRVGIFHVFHDKEVDPFDLFVIGHSQEEVNLV